MAINCPDTPNEKSPPLANCPALGCVHAKVPRAIDRPFSPFGNEAPQPNFPLPPVVCEIDADPLAIGCPCSPFGSHDGLDAENLEEVSSLLNLPDKDQLQEVDNMADLPDDTLFDAFRLKKDERLQSGLGLDMVSRGQHFRPVVHAARRSKAFLASNMWSGPSPAFNGLPRSYAHRRKGSRRHFAEVLAPISIVAHKLCCKSPIQRIGA